MKRDQRGHKRPKKGEGVHFLVLCLFAVMGALVFIFPAFYLIFLRGPLSEVYELAPLGTEGSPGIFLPRGRLFAQGADDLHHGVFWILSWLFFKPLMRRSAASPFTVPVMAPMSRRKGVMRRTGSIF